MKIKMDTDAEAAYVRFTDGKWAKSVFPGDAITLDYDAEDNLIGIELIGEPAKLLSVETFAREDWYQR